MPDTPTSPTSARQRMLTSAHGLWTGFRQRFLSEVGPVLGVAVLLLGVLIFLGVADEALEGETRTLDTSILLALRNPADATDPLGPAWFEHAMADITALGGFAVLTLLVGMIAVFLVVMRKWGTAILLVAAPVTGTLLSEGLKLGFARPRPDLVSHLVETQSASFPSGHAMLAAITYLTLGVLLARITQGRFAKGLIIAFAIGLTVLIGASRIYLGVHWPSDVLAGWCLGAAWASMWWLAAWALQKRGSITGDASPPA